jgi:hypothetical protein
VKLHNFWALSLMLLFISAIYTTYLFVDLGTTNPMMVLPAIMEDLENLGPWAFLLDAIVLLLIILFVRSRKKEKSKSIWETD